MYDLLQVRQDIHVDSKHQTIQGVAFPVSQEAIQALKNITAGASDYVQLVCWIHHLYEPYFLDLENLFKIIYSLT